MLMNFEGCSILYSSIFHGEKHHMYTHSKQYIYFWRSYNSSVCICVEVLVELTESMYQMREDLGSIVSRISYNQALANNITINFYPVTYNHYLNVLGLHLPDKLSLIESHAQGMYITTSRRVYIQEPMSVECAKDQVTPHKTRKVASSPL